MHSVGGSFCNSDNICACEATRAVGSGNSACLAIELGDECQSSDNCGLVNSSSCRLNNENTLVCQCDVGYIQVSDALCRLPVIGEDVCLTQSDCSSIGHASCMNETCQCQSGYEVNDVGTDCDPCKLT